MTEKNAARPNSANIRLLSLTLDGFKSFARKTELHINDGLTGVLGANGSGKSSLFDALIWAIGGEMSDENDLIFSGSKQYPASEKAEVQMRFSTNNAENSWMEITKRVRKGEASAYRINNKPARSLEIREFLTSTGFRADTPAFLRGHMIDNLDGNKNLMQMLELASGIDGLAIRREEAQKRLNSAIERLRELDLSAATLGQDIEETRQKNEQSRHYSILSRRIHGLQARLQLQKWHSARRQADGMRMRVKAISARLDSHIAIQENILSKQQKSREQTKTARTNMDEARNTLSDLQLERERYIGKENSLRSNMEIMQNQLSYLQKQLDTKEKTLARLMEIDWPDPVKNSTSIQTLPSPESFDENSALQALEEAGIQHKNAREILEKNAAHLAEIASNETAVQREQERLDSLQKERRALKQTEIELPSPDNVKKKLEQTQKQLANSNKTLQTTRKQREEKIQKLKKQRTLYEQTVEHSHALHSQVHGHCAEMAMLEALLPTQKTNRNDSAPNRLIDLMDIDPPLLKAAQAALGPEIQASINMRDQQHWSRKTGSVGLYLPEGARPLSELLDAPEWLARCLSQCGLIKAEDGPRLQTQLQQGQCLVSLEGDMWRWDGLVRQADYAQQPENNSDELQLRHSQCEKRLLDTRDNLRDARTKEKTALSLMEKLEQELNDANNAENKALEHLQKSGQAQLPAEREWERLKQIQRNAQKNQEFLNHLNADCQKIMDELSPQDNDRENALADLEEARQMLDRAQNHETSTKISIERAQERSRLSSLLKERDQQDLSRIRSMRSSLKQLHTSMQEQKQQISNFIETLENQLEDNEKDCNKVVAKISTLDRSIAQASETLQKTGRELEVLNSECRAQEKKLSSIREPQKDRNDLQRAEIQLEEALIQEENIEKVAKNEFQTDLPGLDSMVQALPAEIGDPIESSRDNIDKKQEMLQELLAEQQQMGNIDENDPNRLQLLESRAKNLMNERQELSDAIDRVRESLDFLSQNIQQRLQEHFKQVKSRFSTLFQALLGGGSAQLHLTKVGELEIKITLPGKKTAPLKQLSRGQFHLTMLAFIFSVFLSRPAPLCVLDQIDEALDHNGQDRLLQLLQWLARNSKTRFVLISRNTSMVSKFDQAYAISMEENGLSSLRKIAGNTTASNVAA